MNDQLMQLMKGPSPIAEEAGKACSLDGNFDEGEDGGGGDDDDDDDLSRSYVQTIKRIINRSQSVPNQNLPHLETSFTVVTDNCSINSTTENHDTFEFELPSFKTNNNHNNNNIFDYQATHSGFADAKSAPFADRHFASASYDSLYNGSGQSINQNLNLHPHQSSPKLYSQHRVHHHHHHHYADQDRERHSTTGAPLNANDSQDDFSDSDLNHKWSWKNLKREFKLSHSENLFHLYQAKLQHSFFVASLILNIIFNFGAIISYGVSRYHEMNLYLILMRFASIIVYASFLTFVSFNKTWMKSKFSRTVASLTVLLAMIFGEASK